MAQADHQQEAPVTYEPASQVYSPAAQPIGYPADQIQYVAPPPIGYPTKDDSGHPPQHTPAETKMRGSIEIQCCCFIWRRS